MVPDFKMGHHLIKMLPEQEEEKQDGDAELKEGDKKNANIKDEVKHYSCFFSIFYVVNLIFRSFVDVLDEPDFGAEKLEKTKNCFNIFFYLFHYNF